MTAAHNPGMSIDSTGNNHAPKGTPTGGQFTGRDRTDASDVALTHTPQPEAAEVLDVTFDTAQNGDEAIDGSSTMGFIIGKSIRKGVRRLHLHNGSAIRFDDDHADTSQQVRRRTTPLEYDLASHDYWANVAAARDPRQSVEVLQQILDAEAEDDFMLAIAEHPKATPAMLDKASRHNSLQVREAALGREELWMETLWRMKREAEERATAERDLLHAEGVSPNASYRRQSIDAYEQHAAAVSSRIAGANWRD